MSQQQKPQAKPAPVVAIPSIPAPVAPVAPAPVDPVAALDLEPLQPEVTKPEAPEPEPEVEQPPVITEEMQNAEPSPEERVLASIQERCASGEPRFLVIQQMLQENPNDVARAVLKTELATCREKALEDSLEQIGDPIDAMHKDPALRVAILEHLNAKHEADPENVAPLHPLLKRELADFKSGR